MHPHADPHDPGREAERLDAIVLAALGEPVDPDVADHHATCPVCAQDKRQLADVVGLARQAVDPLDTPDIRPPDSVWAGIAAQLGVTDAPAAPAASPFVSPTARHRPATAARRRVTRWAVAAAVAAVVVAASAGGYALGRSGSTAVASCPSTRATLGRMPGGPGDVGGTATVVCSGDGPTLRVTTSRLPLGQGFYEVWLYAPTSGAMVAVGTLGKEGSGTFTLPAGVDLDSYHVIDVSSQQYNGNPAHDVSVLRGPLTH